MARELHVTKDKVEELVKNLVAKDLVTDDNGTVISTESGKELCKKVEKHRVETPIKLLLKCLAKMRLWVWLMF
nr:hypothetical protein [Lactobacillus helveticus]